MKYLLNILALTLISITSLIAEPTETPNGIAAKVEDRIITYDEIQRKVMPLVPQLQRDCRTQQEFSQKLNSVSKETLDTMVDNILLVKEFEAKKGIVPQAYLDTQYNTFLKERFNNDRSLYNQFLKANGKTNREFRAQQREEVIVGYLRSQMDRSKTEISPDKIANYYNQHKEKFVQPEAVHLRQIVVTAAEAEAKTPQILEKLNAGQSFAEVAKEYSTDPMATTGGDHGWINRKDIREELAQVAFDLKPGTSSTPITLNNHVFILFVEDRRPGGILPLEKVRDSIEQALVTELQQKSQQAHMQRLRDRFHVKYYINT